MAFDVKDKFSEEGTTEPISYNPPLEKIRQEKDFIIEKIEIESFSGAKHDLTLARDSIKIYMDIYNTFVSGSITVVDTNDLPYLMPLVGEEKLTLIFTRPNAKSSGNEYYVNTEEEILESINMKFRVYKMADWSKPKDKTQVYTLHFVSEEMLKNLKTKMSRSFKGKTYSEIIQIVYDEKLKVDKELEVEPTKEEQYFVASNKSPSDIIHQVSAHAISDEGHGSNYVFFQDTEKFRFVTLTKLLKEEPKETYVYNVKDMYKPEGGLIDPQAIESDLVSVEAYSRVGGFDVMEKLTRGMFGSKLLAIDSVRESFDEIEFDYKEKWKEFDHLSDNDIVTDTLDVLGAPDAKLFVCSSNTNWKESEYIKSSGIELFPQNIEETLQLRKSQMQWIDTHKIRVSVSGDPRRKAGDVVEFKLPSLLSNLSKEYPNEDDAYLSGKFLVISCVQILDRTQYTMIMEIVKDSVVEALEYSDPLEHYENVY